MMSSKTKPKKNSTPPATQPKRSGKPKPQATVVPESETPTVVETPTTTQAHDNPSVEAVDQPVTARVVTRAQIFGHPVTGVLRRLGKEGFTFTEARKAINAFGASGISDITVRIQLPAGRTGKRGEPAPLTKEQLAELTAAKN